MKRIEKEISTATADMRRFERLLVIGCGGSGKSTLAVRLGETTGLPVVHLDRLYWTPGWVHRSSEEFDVLLTAELDKPQWIIDGNFKRTLSKRLEKCDAVVLLDYPRLVCAVGVLRRQIRYAGRTRESMGDGCIERIEPGFLRWVWNFRKNTLPYVYSCLERRLQQGEPIQIFILKNRKQARRWLTAAGAIMGAQQSCTDELR